MEYPIPQASLERIRVAYANVEQLAAVIAEAVGVPPGVRRNLDLQRSVFVTDEAAQPANGTVAQQEVPA